MRPLRNTLLSAIVTGSRVASVAVTMLWIARALGPTGFGTFTYALTLATVLAVVPDYGFSLQFVARAAATPERARGLLRSAALAKCYLVAGAVLCGVVWAVVQQPSGEVLRMAGVLFLSAIALSFGQLNSFAFRGVDRFDLDAITSATRNCALVCCVLLVYFRGGGAMAIAWAYLAVRLLYLALTLVLLRKLPPDAGSGPVTSPVQMLREGFSYGVHTTVAVLYVSLDSLVLAAYRGETVVGYYQAGIRLVFASAILPEILTSGLFPSLSRAVALGRQNEATVLGTTMHRYLLLAGAAAASIFLVVPGAVRHLLYGRSYATLDALLPWFGLVIFLRYAASAYGAAITAAGAQRSRTLATVGAAILNAVANFTLIPRFGVMGAVAASTATHTVLLVLYAVLARNALDDWLLDRRATIGLLLLVLLAGLSFRASAVAPLTAPLVCPVLLAGCAIAAAVPRHEWRQLRDTITARFSSECPT